MKWKYKDILDVLDSCASSFDFPVLDNGYVYPAASKLSVYRSEVDWAFVIEIFGYSPRSQDPDISIYTIASKLIDRNPQENYVTAEAYNTYLQANPHNEFRSVFPIKNNEWQSADDPDYVNVGGICSLRNIQIPVPEVTTFPVAGIELEEERLQTFEFCRFLASHYVDSVLCTEIERKISVGSELELLFRAAEWLHPDITSGELPSETKTFKDASLAIVSGNTANITHSGRTNSHWSNWPEAGTL